MDHYTPPSCTYNGGLTLGQENIKEMGPDYKGCPMQALTLNYSKSITLHFSRRRIKALTLLSTKLLYLQINHTRTVKFDISLLPWHRMWLQHWPDPQNGTNPLPMLEWDTHSIWTTAYWTVYSCCIEDINNTPSLARHTCVHVGLRYYIHECTVANELNIQRVSELQREAVASFPANAGCMRGGTTSPKNILECRTYPHGGRSGETSSWWLEGYSL